MGSVDVNTVPDTRLHARRVFMTVMLPALLMAYVAVPLAVARR